jgi:nucleotide-binding universal stress UspA family protein
MSTILVAIDDPTRTSTVLDAALTRAARTDATLVVANIVPASEYETRRGSIAQSGDLRREGLGYTYTQACNEAKAAGERAIGRVLGDREIPIEVVGDVGPLLPTALELADQYDCSTVLVEKTPQRLRDRLGLTRWLAGSRFGGVIEQVPATLRSPSVAAGSSVEA